MKIKPWKIIPAVIKGLQIATKLHEEHKASGKDLDDFVKTEMMNRGIKEAGKHF